MIALYKSHIISNVQIVHLSKKDVYGHLFSNIECHTFMDKSWTFGHLDNFILVKIWTFILFYILVVYHNGILNINF